MPQMWLLSPTRPVTLPKAHLTNGVALHRERTPQIGIKAPQVGTEVPPNRQGQRGPGVHPGDSPDSWWMCHGAPKALFLILQKSKSSQRRNLGQFGEGKKRISSGQRKPRQLLGQPLPSSPQLGSYVLNKPWKLSFFPNHMVSNTWVWLEVRRTPRLLAIIIATVCGANPK